MLLEWVDALEKAVDIQEEQVNELPELCQHSPAPGCMLVAAMMLAMQVSQTNAVSTAGHVNGAI